MIRQLTKTALFECDLQERFRPLIHKFPAVVHTAQKMIKAGRMLDLPLVVTEQYPKALGSTVPELEVVHAVCHDSKTRFSMVTDKVRSFLQERQVVDVILFGIESHVCVLQTAFDLRQMNVNVHVLADGVSSAHPTEIPIALKRMRQMGCMITTSDSVLFQMCGDAKHEHFKRISQLVKESQSNADLHNALLK